MGQTHVIRGMAAGLLAGCAAAWVMNQFKQMEPVNKPQGNRGAGQRQGGSTQGGSGYNDPQEKKASEASAESSATVKTAEAISQRVLHHELSPKEKELA